VYVYNAQGQLAAEYTSAGSTTPPCVTCYLTADHLGSTRLVSDGHTVCNKRYDYRPFGEDIPVGIGEMVKRGAFSVASGSANRPLMLLIPRIALFPFPA
jgi:hypothetical protein